MRKPTFVIRGPVNTRSGYGAMSRDIVRHIIEMDVFDVQVHSCRWGTTPMGILDPDEPKDAMILDRIVPEEINPNKLPEVYASITIPTEFRRFGKYNIGITAGIETTAATPQWVQAMNVMDLNLVISKHSKDVFLASRYNQHGEGGKIIGELFCEKPIEILPNCVDTYTFKKTNKLDLEKTVRKELDDVEENFGFLFVGHWLNGNLGHDRKNVGLLVKIFCELFKRAEFDPKPALIMKVSSANNSIMDREEVFNKIQHIKNSVALAEGESLPNIYVVHGELTDSEMNSLYNHPKVKCHISLTKGEGFGRPLLEATQSGKPLIVSGWSGHLDFTNREEAILLGGQLGKIDPSARAGDWMFEHAQWFDVDQNMAASAMVEIFRNYSHWHKKAKGLARRNRNTFNYKAIQKMTSELLMSYIPEELSVEQPDVVEAVPVSINLPTLEDIGLPKLETV
ncbi:MAG: glycosyltransferase [Betaproteobacteria bacterium]|jgi:glycosyltransferase involved in cell wall biosynthesis